MRRTSTWVGLAAVLALAVPAAAVDTKPEKTAKPTAKAPAKGQKAETKDTKLAGGKFIAKVVTVEGSQKTLTVEITLKYPVLNQGEADAVQSWQVELLKKPNDANHVFECRKHIAYHSSRVWSLGEKKENVDLQTIEEVKVLTAIPPPAFDDNGKPKKRTAKELKELKELKGNNAGYPAEFDSLKPQQFVEVTLLKKKATTRKPKEGEPVEKPSVTQLIIVAEAKK